MGSRSIIVRIVEVYEFVSIPKEGLNANNVVVLLLVNMEERGIAVNSVVAMVYVSIISRYDIVLIVMVHEYVRDIRNLIILDAAHMVILNMTVSALIVLPICSNMILGY